MRRIDGIVIHRSEAGHTGGQVNSTAPNTYHLFIRRDGTIDLVFGTLGFQRSGAHAVGYNAHTIAIAVYGCFIKPPPNIRFRNQYPTDDQLDSLMTLIEGLKWWLGKDLWVMGHTELPKASRDPDKICPGPYLPLDLIRLITNSHRKV